MVGQSFADATLVLFGHGSTVDSGSAAPVYQHAAELRRRNIFADVREAFWKQEPRITEVVASVGTPRVFLAPLFTSEGYFTDDLIPKALGFDRQNPDGRARVMKLGNQTIYYCRPAGTHDGFADLLLARAREVVEKSPFPRAPGAKDTTLFIAGHGTLQNGNSRKAVERQAELIRARNLYAAVHAVFLEEAPRVDECYQLSQTRNFIVVPFFISDGPHVRQDLPILLGEPERLVQQRLRDGLPTWRNPTERRRCLVWCAAAAGSHPRVADMVLEMVNQTCPVVGVGEHSPAKSAC